MTRWTARIALILYALTLARRLHRPSPAAERGLRWGSRLALLLTIGHVVLAFAIEHSGSHRAALEHTGDETERVFGFRFEAGLYVNYLFLALWGLDEVLAWRRGPAWLASLGHRGFRGGLHFVMFQSAVVFAPSPAREIAGLITLVLVVLWLARRRRAAGQDKRLSGN